jgi:hypothetical protein
VGRLDSTKPAAIRLSGESILDEHCYFENTDGRVVLYAMSGSNTVRVRLIINTHYLIYVVPKRKTIAIGCGMCSESSFDETLIKV